MKGCFALKKLISILLCISTVVSILAITAVPSAAMLYRKGDANADGVINSVDSYFVKSKIAGFDIPADELAVDVNSDGTVNTVDSYALKSHIAGATLINDAFPEGCGWRGFTVMGTPIAEYTVVVTNPDNANMVFAAEELQKFVKKGDGETELNIVYGDSSVANRIIIKEDETGEMGTDGFNIKTVGTDVVITGGALRGTMYAVYEILEAYFGFSFYAYGDWRLDKNLKTDIPEGVDDTQIPTVRYRCVCITGFNDQYTESTVIKRKLSGCSTQSSMLKAKYGYGIQRSRANAHSFDVFIPYEDLIAAGGTGANRCLSQKRTKEVCVTNMIKHLDERVAAGAVVGKDLTEISCSYAADDVPCVCFLCKKVYREEGNRHSGNLVRFVNAVHAEIVKVYPEIRVIVNAYATLENSWHDAPKVSSLNEGITLLYCWNGCANHMLGKEGCSDRGNSRGTTNKKAEADFLAWNEKCSDVYVWYYPTNIYYMLCPQPNFENIYNDFRWFIDNGAKGFYVVGTDGGSFETLNGQLISDMMWDPNMTKEEYDFKVATYLRDQYGYGWIYIKEYMDMLVECGDLKGCVLNDFELPFDVYSKDYFKENYDKMCELFKKAIAQADNEDELYNIERLSVHMHFLGLSALYEDRYVNGSEEQRIAYGDQWRWTYDFINENDMHITYDSTGIDSQYTLDINPLNQAYPDIGDGER